MHAATPVQHEHATTSSSDGSFFSNLLESYTPRRACMNFEPEVIWLHVVSDTLIATAYFSIPLALIYFVRRRADLAFSWMFVMFATFILACGTTHVFGVWAIWQPLYKIDGLVKLATALVSIATAVQLWRLVPAALALPSPAQLREMNRKLESEIAERKRAQEVQLALQGELEERVAARTEELEARNRSLRNEIDARHEAERQRNELLASTRAARDEAERANRLKDDFLATLSHELRTPLNAIQGWAGLLRSGRIAPSEVDRGLEVIERNTAMQTQLIEDLLDMSRILSGKMRLDVQLVDLTQVVRAAVASIAPAAEAKGLRITAVLEPRVERIRGDPSRLQQVVWNLLSNAVKFTPKGGQVQVSLERVDSNLQIQVSDTGCGLDPAFMPRLFERFAQAETGHRRAGHGLGLGLSIVRNLVDLHGGTVSATSAGVGRGSTFVVSLPILSHPAAHAPLDPASIEPRSTANIDLSGLAVLVVEDDPDARLVIQRILEVCGADVVTASSVDEAWARWNERRPDIVVSDIGMSDQDGYALARALRRLPASEGGHVPAVALTALASSEDRRRVLQAGFQMHVVKPVDPDELVAVVASHMGRLRDDSRGDRG